MLGSEVWGDRPRVGRYREGQCWGLRCGGRDRPRVGRYREGQCWGLRCGGEG